MMHFQNRKKWMSWNPNWAFSLFFICLSGNFLLFFIWKNTSYIPLQFNRYLYANLLILKITNEDSLTNNLHKLQFVDFFLENQLNRHWQNIVIFINDESKLTTNKLHHKHRLYENLNVIKWLIEQVLRGLPC